MMHKDRKKEDKEKEEIERKATSFFRFCQSFSVLSEKTPHEERKSREIPSGKAEEYVLRQQPRPRGYP